MNNYKKVIITEPPNEKKLKALGLGQFARTELEKEIAKADPDWKAILIAEMMQRLGMK